MFVMSYLLEKKQEELVVYFRIHVSTTLVILTLKFQKKCVYLYLWH